MTSSSAPWIPLMSSSSSLASSLSSSAPSSVSSFASSSSLSSSLFLVFVAIIVSFFLSRAHRHPIVVFIVATTALLLCHRHSVPFSLSSSSSSLLSSSSSESLSLPNGRFGCRTRPLLLLSMRARVLDPHLAPRWARVCAHCVCLCACASKRKSQPCLGESNPGRALYSPGSVSIVVVCLRYRVTFHIKKELYGELIDDLN